MAWELKNTYHFRGGRVKWDSKGAGQPVVLVHGTPWSSFNLRHLIEGLSETKQVYYYDLLGYGQSDKPDNDVSLGIQNEILNGLLKYWGLERPIMIGHDFGGTTVLRTLILNKIEFASLIVIDPVAISPWGSSFFRHVNKHEQAFAGMPDYIHEAIVEAYIKTAAHRELGSDTIRGTLLPWKGDEGKAAFYRQIAQADPKYTDEIQDQYGSIDTPTLILWGERDQWIPLDKGKALNKLIPDSEFRVIPDSGHLVIEEEPEKIIQAIRAFLKKTRGNGKEGPASRS